MAVNQFQIFFRAQTGEAIHILKLFLWAFSFDILFHFSNFNESLNVKCISCNTANYYYLLFIQWSHDGLLTPVNWDLQNPVKFQAQAVFNYLFL